MSLSPTRELPGTYDDESVDRFAQVDAGARVGTTEWGDQTNSWPHSIEGIDASAGTATDLVTIGLQSELAPLEGLLEKERVRFPVHQANAFKALDTQEQAELEQDRVMEEARAKGLTLPDRAWRRMFIELLAFFTLAVGDLYFTATAFQVFGLSDKQVGFLPLNELQLAATSVVSAMLTLSWLAGHQARGAAHDITQAVKGTHARKWGWVMAAAFTAAGAGAMLILKGLSDVRTSFLTQQGINAEQSAFFSIQLGVAIAGFSLAFWGASPLHQKWQRVTHNLAKATKVARKACTKAMASAGTYNATVRERIALLQRYRAWSEAVRHDAIRKGHLYGTLFRAAFPEPVADANLPTELAGPDPSYLVTQIDALMVGEPSTLKDYPDISTSRLEARLDEVDARRQARHTARSGKKR